VEDRAIVSLVNDVNGDRIEAECTVQTLERNGIHKGDEFRCDVFERDNTASVRLSKLPPKSVSPEQIRALLKDVKDVAL
jgi:hypothetical protein